MKRHLLALSILCITSASCTKTYCWKCTTNQTMYYRNGTQINYGGGETQACGLSELEVKNYEQLGSQSVTGPDGTFVTIRTCTR